MIELKEWAIQLKTQLNNKENSFIIDLNDFLINNNWFDQELKWENEKLYISSSINNYIDRISEFFQCKDLAISEKINLLSMRLDKFSTTNKLLQRFCDENNILDTTIYQLFDFLLFNLKKEIVFMTDHEVELLLEAAFHMQTKSFGDILTFFLSWTKEQFKTNYQKDYTMSKRVDRSEANEAYDTDEYLELIYYLFNPDYIERNEMYKKAAESKNFADTWLFLSLHFISSLRKSDLFRLPHPVLHIAPKEIISLVLNGDFEEYDAKLILNSMIWKLKYIPMVPNKTKDTTGIANIKFHIPQSVETHMGILFSLCESHRIIQNIPDDTPLIRSITTYEQISRYMGDEIGNLFLTSNFRSRSANKSYLQAFNMYADDILQDNDNGICPKGYMLAALARSHKGSYGDFAKSTVTYLKDAKFSGLTAEFVARELFERGVLSFIPSMLLEMISNGAYKKLSIKTQTNLIKELDMSPYEIENIIKVSQKAKKQSYEIASILFKQAEDNEDYLLKILHRIGNGEAFSKQDDCMCLITAMHKVCPYPESNHCISCQYQIATKSLIYYITNEYNRLVKLYKTEINILEKTRYKAILETIILPTMDDILSCAENYNRDEFEYLVKFIKENTVNA